jgi:hypothetical protein
MMKWFAGLGIGYLAVLAFLAIGWVINVVKIVNHIDDALTMMMLLRAVGVIAFPLGGIVGWF